jgi:transcriptional regulator with XRE-family HTH domain
MVIRRFNEECESYKDGARAHMSLRTQLLSKLKNKEYRDSFVAEYIFSRIPLKIRAMRDRRKMSQQQLGEAAGVKQEWISKLEDPSYGKLTIKTLLKIAAAFDCGLSIDFVPFSQILNGATRLAPSSFDVPSFDEDEALEAEPKIVPLSPAGGASLNYYRAPDPRNSAQALPAKRVDAGKVAQQVVIAA